ncbi:c-type cytochrome biogenesis protein CcsB [Agilicoccus flavus]|uniref:c-type cytochrome biogenesis protein CcsB n=1 Tax=Agilicoccus flavus TaxID=2775968 RepID=UPI001CF6901D|nr:c-type cytochrome biogenesis protein CcsB [Agilicoccus flavus]
MDPQGLASLSNTVLYTAMGVLAFAMIAFALHTAKVTSARSAPPQDRTRELVGAGASARAGEATHGVEAGDAGDATGTTGATAGSSAVGGPQPGPGSPGARVGAWAMSLSWLATMLLLVSMVLRGLSVRRAPVSNMFEFAVAGSFVVLALYLALAQRRPLKWLGVFVVTPVLLVLGIAIRSWYTAASELVPSLQDAWLVIHVPVAILATAIFTLGFIVLLLQLAQARREQAIARGQRGRPRFLAGLPDSTSLDRTAYSLNILGFPLWTFTLIAGAIWGQKAWGTYWSWDPKEVWTFVIWTIYAAYLHARATSGWSLRTANIIAVVGYLAIIVNFTIVNYFFPGMHSYSGVSAP